MEQVNIDVKQGILNKEYFNSAGKERIDKNSSDDLNVLYIAFDCFNENFFNNELDVPTILIAPNMRCLGKVSRPDAWEKRKYQNTEAIKEENMLLQLSDKVLEYTRIEDVYLELVKTMILQYDLEQEAIYKALNEKYKRIVGNNNNYFSIRYPAICEQCGLVASPVMKKDNDGNEVQSGKYDVKPGERFKEVIALNMLAKYQLSVRRNSDIKENKKDGSHSRLFVCPQCGLKVRVKVKTKNPLFKCYTEENCNGAEFVEDKKSKK